MIRFTLLIATVTGGVLLGAARLAADDFTGMPRVLDGDTLEIAGQVFRLEGADAPPGNAVCGKPGQQWRCGMEATMALSLEMAHHRVTYSPREYDVDGVPFAQCKTGPYDLAELTVLSGWAMAGPAFVLQEQIARGQGKGIWRGGYVPPPGWRGAGLTR